MDTAPSASHHHMARGKGTSGRGPKRDSYILSPKFRMTEEVCRTRSQKRPMDWGPADGEVDSKRARMERGPSAADGSTEGDTRPTPEPGAGPTAGVAVAATGAEGRGEGQVDEEPVDMRTSSG